MFFRKSDLKAKPVLEGVTLRAVAGDKTMMTFFDLKPQACIPPHRHPHEQISYVLEGEIEFTLEGEAKILRKGDGVVVGADKEHSVRVLDEPALAVDAWYPIRDDYR